MTSTWESDWQLAARERDDLVAERDALATQNTALIKQMGASVENERQWGERVAKLEAALHEICGDSTEIGVIATAEIALELRAHSPPLLERTLQAGYDIQTRQRDEIRELKKALDAIHIVAVNDKSGCPRCTEVVERCIAATPPERVSKQ